jgi:hypothetical protein
VKGPAGSKSSSSKQRQLNSADMLKALQQYGMFELTAQPPSGSGQSSSQQQSGSSQQQSGSSQQQSGSSQQQSGSSQRQSGSSQRQSGSSQRQSKSATTYRAHQKRSTAASTKRRKRASAT